MVPSMSTTNTSADKAEDSVKREPTSSACNALPLQQDKYGYGVRHIQILCMCLTMISLFIARGCQGVAVLAMTDMRRKNDPNITVYEWDKKIQGLILSSFFWGYSLMQIPAGLLSKRYGGKPVLLVSLLANGVICALLPTLVQFGGWQIVCACRTLMGLTQAFLFPSNHTLLGKWLPAQERTSFTGVVYCGIEIGIMTVMLVSGVLSETAMGWKLIFYTVSCVMFFTATVWALFAANSPRDHRLMSNDELEYIERGLNAAGVKILTTPWKRIFTTRGLWANIISHFGNTNGFVLFLVDMPTFLEKGLQISLKNSASLSALPYMGMLIGNIAATSICEKIYNKGYLSLGTCRKIFNSISFFGMAISLTILSSIGPDAKSIAIATLVGAHIFLGSSSAGFMSAHLDLSPNYAGVMLSITNFMANIGSVLTPIGTSFILRNDPTDISRWCIVFLMTATVSIISSIGFIWLGSSERQEWDDPNYLDKKQADPEEIQPSIDSADKK